MFFELTACVNTKNILPLLIALSLIHLLFTLCQQDVNQGIVQMTNICLFLLYIIYRFRQVQVMHSWSFAQSIPPILTWIEVQVLLSYWNLWRTNIVRINIRVKWNVVVAAVDVLLKGKRVFFHNHSINGEFILFRSWIC